MPIRRGLVTLVLALFWVGCGPPPPPLPARSPAASGSAGAPSRAARRTPPYRHEHHGAHGPGHQPPTASHRFDDVEHWQQVFDDPARDSWQRPDELVRELALFPDDTVADLGAGTGYFLERLARAVPQGEVLEIDVEPKLVEHMKRRAERAGAGNVRAVLAQPDDPKLPAGVSVVLVVDTYHHIGDRTAYFKRVKDKLASRGRVVIVDFKPGKLPVGPPEDHKLAPEVVEREMAAAGYARCRSWDGLPYQYFLVFAGKC